MRCLFFVVAAAFGVPAAAELSFSDYVKPFVDGYTNLKSKKIEPVKAYILDYEFKHSAELESTYYRGYSKEKREKLLTILEDYVKELPKSTKVYSQKRDQIIETATFVNRKFKEYFGDGVKARIQLHSVLSGTDANVRSFDNEVVISMNLRQVWNYSKDEIEVVLAHELFHVLQGKFQENRPEALPIEGGLFGEGLATFVSSLIFPGKPDWKYISYFKKDDEQYKKMEKSRQDLVKEILADWDSKDEKKKDKFFSGDSEITKPFEPRSGYYLGYKVAQKMAEKISAKEVATMKFSDYRKAIREIIKEIGK